MTYWHVLFAVPGMIAALVVLCLAVIHREKQRKEENYDERQAQDRGNAYRISFYVSLFYFLGLLFCMDYLESMESTSMLLYIGVLLQLMVFDIYCLLTHAALPLSERKPWRAVWCYAVLCAVNLAYFGMNVSESGADVSGNALRYLILSAVFGAFALMHLIQYLRDKRGKDE